MLKKKVLAGLTTVTMLLSILGINIITSAAAPNRLNNVNSWTNSIGTATQADNGITFGGSGTDVIMQTYYKDSFANIDGFHVTLNLDSIGHAGNTNFSVILADTKSANDVFDANTKGVHIFFTPNGENTDIYACGIDTYYSAGGTTFTPTASNYLEINKNSGSIDVLFMKAGTEWHVFINGTDRGIDLSNVKAVLDAGNMYFGLNAGATVTNNYGIRVSEINGISTGTPRIANVSSFIKSNKSNISDNQNAIIKTDGVYLTGSVTAPGISTFKYGYNKIFNQFNGFSTTMHVTMDGAQGVNGSPNFNFGLSSTGDGTINADRLDVWDYFGSQVLGARALQIKFIKNPTYFNVDLFVLGDNGQFDHPADVLSGAIILPDANGNVTISFLTTNNGGSSHWMILANGRIIIDNHPTINAELDALSITGASPFYSAGYDNIGSLSTANAQMIISNIGGSTLEKTFFGDYVVSPTNIITNLQLGTTVTEFKNEIAPVDATYNFTNINADIVGTGTTVEITVNGEAKTYTALIYGDLDGNGLIELEDLICVRDSILETLTLNPIETLAGDLYGEGSVTLNDLVGIMAKVSESGTISQNPTI